MIDGSMIDGPVTDGPVTDGPVTDGPVTDGPRADADAATGLTLFSCLVREVCAPEQQAWPIRPHLVVRLARSDIVLRAGLRRRPVGPALRFAPPVEELRVSGWAPVDWRRLADLVAKELELATGVTNPEFAGQVADSRAAMAAILQARAAGRVGSTDGHETEPAGPRRPTGDPYVESEQSLVFGHPAHPTPKARQGAPGDWLPFAPETRARFRLHWLAVRDDLIAQDGDAAALARMERLGPIPEAGYRTLPVHPWQLELLRSRPVMRAALDSGALLDLGPAGSVAAPTSSVRTVYLPDGDLFLKFSLDVRITNCVRKNAWYELSGAVALTRALRPVFASLSDRFDGCALLGEPACRSVALADRRCHEGLGVIVRDGVRGLRGSPLLAAALIASHGPNLLAGRSAEYALTWWDGYVRRVTSPVLHAFLSHGVVLEPHLQNVLIAVDAAGMPAQAVFRDLEGAKLLRGRWAEFLDGLPDRVAAAMTYDIERGWNRVVYCLFVNHLAEVAAAIADLHPALERELWRRARRHVVHYGDEHGCPPRLRALLAGVPLPAKANLRTRWVRIADRWAEYVPVPNPFADRDVRDTISRSPLGDCGITAQE